MELRFESSAKSFRKEFRVMRSILERTYYALGPLGVGFILDVLDLATFGPIGIALGPVVGAAAGWIIGDLEGVGRNGRIVLACCAAIYMFIPFTEPIPVATCFGLAARFFRNPPAKRGAGSNESEARSDDS
jgi:hypothetical protein